MSTDRDDPLFPLLAQSSLYLEQFLTKLGESNIFSLCIKDLKTKRVCLNNAVCEKFWGFPYNAMQGMTAREIFTHVPHFVNVEQALKQVEENEQWAIQNHHFSLFKQILLSYDGFVQVRQSLIAPLSGTHNRLIATSGIGLDITHHADLLRLLACYRDYYPKASEAVAKFCAYFKLNTYFYRPLSYEELRTLLTMLKDSRHKQVAASLQISSKTVANYLASIRAKLKEGFECYDLISILRVQAQHKME